MSEVALGIRHQRVQRLRRLLQQKSTRRAEHAFVAEGVKVIDAALDAGVLPEAIYAAPDAEAHVASATLLARASSLGVRIVALGPGVLERAADASTPQPVAAVFATLDRPIERLAVDLDTDALVLVLVDVRDPGNVGAIFRSAEAAGVAAIVCCTRSADPYNPKTVRASAGALFALPFTADVAPHAAFSALRGAGVRLVGTASRNGADYGETSLAGPVALVLGNEANGLDEAIADELDELVTIPIAGRAESLNVAMAATILCFEAARRRRAARGRSGEPVA